MKKQQFRAQTLVEFALVIPIALFLILGFFDIGRAIFNFASLSNSVREGTRYAIVHKEAVNAAAQNAGYSELKQKVFDYSFGISDSDITVDVLVTLVNASRDKISITATYLFVPVTPGIKQILGDGNGIPIVAQSTMLLEPISRDD